MYSQIFLKQSEKKYISDVNKAQERFFSCYHFSFIFTQQQDKTLYNKGFLITAYHTFNMAQLYTQELMIILSWTIFLPESQTSVKAVRERKEQWQWGRFTEH